MTTERDIQSTIMEGVSRAGVVIFRNNTGALKDAMGRLVRFGLCVGSSDLIGWKPVTITQDMVGQEVAVFTALEVKKPRGRPTEKQEYFIGRVKGDGGYAGIVRSLAEALRIVEGG